MSDSLRPHGLQHTRPPCHLRAKTIQIFIWIKIKRFIYISSVQSLSCFRLFETPPTAACQTSLSFTISQSLLKLMSIESVMPSNYLIFYCPLLLLPSALPSNRLPCPSLSPAVCSNWCSLSRWCHPVISSSVALFSSCPQSFPALGSFPFNRYKRLYNLPTVT